MAKRRRDCPMRPVDGARTAKLYDVSCDRCGSKHEDFFYDPPPPGTVLRCAGQCGDAPHSRVYSIQGIYTYRTADSPSHAGKPTCVIGECSR